MNRAVDKLALHKNLASTKTPQEKESVQRQVESTAMANKIIEAKKNFDFMPAQILLLHYKTKPPKDLSLGGLTC